MQTQILFQSWGLPARSVCGMPDSPGIRFAKSVSAGLLTRLAMVQQNPAHTKNPKSLRDSSCSQGMVAVRRVLLLAVVQTSVRLQTHAALAGHSLGGALATLAAYDLATELALPHVHCVTFGAPRVGNSVFVSDYDRHVPEHMVNSPLIAALHICKLEINALVCYQRRIAVWLAVSRANRWALHPAAGCGCQGSSDPCLRLPAKSDVQAKVKAVSENRGHGRGRHVINDQDAVTKAAKFVRLYRCCSALAPAPVSSGFFNFQLASGRSSLCALHRLLLKSNLVQYSQAVQSFSASA